MNELAKYSQFNGVVARFKISFALIQKQLKDDLYLQNYKQAAILMYNCKSTKINKRTLIGYLVYKYSKNSVNYEECLELINNSVQLLQQYQQGSQDELILIQKLESLKPKIRINSTLIKNSRDLKVDNILSKKLGSLNIDNYIQKEKEQYLDQSDINIFQQIATINNNKPQKKQVVNKSGQQFMIKNKSHSSKNLLNMVRNRSLNSQQSVQNANKVRMAQIYDGGKKKE